MKHMISGLHAIIYSKQAERLREFLTDVLELPSVDAGGGWLIYSAPPAELAVHPDQSSHHEFYLMCEDVQATAAALKAKGVELAIPIADRGWGLVTRLRLPSGDEIGLYQPKHPTALGVISKRAKVGKSKSRNKSRLVKKKVANKATSNARR
jgi:hypothetical protein